MVSSLPPELCDSIIEIVLDETTLKSCSLVSKSWVGRSQRSIFRRLRIPPAGQSVTPATTIQIQRAVEALNTYPHLLPLVRELSVAIPRNGAGQIALGNLVVLVAPRLERLELDGCVNSWPRIIPDLRDVLLATMSAPRVDRVYLTRLASFPVSAIHDILHTSRAVALTDVVVRDDGSTPMKLVMQQPPPLRYLHLPWFTIRPILLAALPHGPRTYSLLEFLRVERYDVHYRPILQAAATTLVTLELTSSDGVVDWEFPLLPALQTLDLSFAAKNVDSLCITLPPSVLSCISRLPSFAPVVERLVLRVTVQIFVVRPLKWVDPEARSMLSQPVIVEPFGDSGYGDALPCFREMEVTMAYGDPMRTLENMPAEYAAPVLSTFRACEQYMGDKFPGLKSAGGLRVRGEDVWRRLQSRGSFSGVDYLP